jgi:hypothetical protein
MAGGAGPSLCGHSLSSTALRILSHPTLVDEPEVFFLFASYHFVAVFVLIGKAVFCILHTFVQVSNRDYECPGEI